ncbi:hypothetical protein F4801DRAFT_55162 [Xylaria longipes]|nr:hypothetical protein F4801DRAFT_55162 [Xylaria longipes]RYC56576.1 hypothetical protein CHU98_g9630 [Xylaria longipes]
MTLPEISGLFRLPYELVAYVVENLDIEDIFNWSLCNKHFRYLISEDRFCKRVVMTKVPASLEAREALENGRFAQALRRIAKRHNALSQASPYVVGIVACADSYEFFGGKLCYIIEARPHRWLRILDVHGQTNWELVVNIPMLIRAALPRAANCRKYKFRVLYQAAGIVSCLFSFALPGTENWLLILKPQTHQILETFRLESTAKIFVRNNDKFLYFGTHSWMGADGFRKWVIKGFDLDKLCWLPQSRMFLSDMAGCDIGSTACFEIFGDYFYGLSNQSLFEADDLEWTSRYYCFRFPLNEPRLDKTEVMEDEDSLRRKHSEGPIDDRWGFLSLETDESDGGIVILECRKEWLKGESTSRRKYYTTEVIFRQQTVQEGQQTVRAATARRLGDRPQSDTPIPFRRPDYVHEGDDSSVASLLVRNKTYFCTYVRSCHTFIDLIDDTSTDTSGLQRLRLRTGYRRLKPGSRIILEKLASDKPRALSELEMQPYLANAIFVWPPEQHSSGPDPSLDRVRHLLNVDGRQSCVTATGDDRSIIYAASGGSKELKALVLLSFDPATKFEGMEYGGNIVGQRTSHDPKEGIDPGGANSSTALHFSPNVPLGAADGMKCKAADGPATLPSWHAAPTSPAPSPPLIPDAPEGIGSWTRYERAMHLEIQRKLCFSR